MQSHPSVCFHSNFWIENFYTCMGHDDSSPGIVGRSLRQTSKGKVRGWNAVSKTSIEDSFLIMSVDLFHHFVCCSTAANSLRFGLNWFIRIFWSWVTALQRKAFQIVWAVLLRCCSCAPANGVKSLFISCSVTCYCISTVNIFFRFCVYTNF